jgi:polyferredoxin
MQENVTQNNPLQNNALAFWAGLVLFFLGLLALLFYLFVRTAQESLIMPGPTLRIKHIILALVLAAAGAVLASFARPRSSTISENSRFNR